ncbi:MAG: DUF3000 domain-containing protein [Actinomycetota bacterium]
MPSSPEPDEAPEAFLRAVTSLREAEHNSNVTLREVPSPGRLAPYSFALSAEVLAGNDDDLAAGRFVVLHNPDGHDGWEGTTRIVAFVQADVEEEMGADPLLPQVGWSWLLDALDSHSAAHHATGGTVTRTSSSRFGALAEQGESCEIELRCSWTPDDDDLAPHLRAFCDVMCSMAGLPPTQPVGVLRLPITGS